MDYAIRMISRMIYRQITDLKKQSINKSNNKTLNLLSYCINIDVRIITFDFKFRIRIIPKNDIENTRISKIKQNLWYVELMCC